MHHSDLQYPLVFLLVGLLLLLLGQRLFWLFVAAAGFLIGVAAAPLILPHQSDLVTLVIAVILGLIGALLAIFVEKLAIAIGGFVAGGYLGTVLSAPLLERAGVAYHPGTWLCFMIGGVLGALLMLIFFNWALILLSSLQGAHMIVRGLPAAHLHLARRHFPILFIVLVVIGIVVQASTYRRRSIEPE